MNPSFLYLHNLKNIEVEKWKSRLCIESITFKKSLNNWISLIRTNYYVNRSMYLIIIAFVIAIVLFIVS